MSGRLLKRRLDRWALQNWRPRDVPLVGLLISLWLCYLLEYHDLGRHLAWFFRTHGEVFWNTGMFGVLLGYLAYHKCADLRDNRKLRRRDRALRIRASRGEEDKS